MKLDFYGVRIDPPTISIAKAFSSSNEPIALEGGQGTTYRSGDIVLKPSEGEEESNWMAEVFDDLTESNEVRIPKPIKSTHGTWIHEGYVAWTYLEGKHVKDQYAEKISASLAFHNLLKGILQPEYLKTPKSSWAAANQVVWQTQEYNYDKEFLELINQITKRLTPLQLPNQLVHGDVSGNFLFQFGLPPAVIDFSPAWAPYGFAEGVMFADAITWENANPKDLEIFKKVPHIEQLALRGILRRIIEQAEHIKWFHKDKDRAIKEAQEFQKAIYVLSAFTTI